MKESKDIIKWGKIKPYFDKTYRFNSIDIETVDNKLFILGYTVNDEYKYVLDDFFNNFNALLIRSIQDNHDIITWSRYDNTHLIKLLLSLKNRKEIRHALLRIGKVTPIFDYKFKNFKITVVNIIKDSIIFAINDGYNKLDKQIIIYNIKNLYTTDLLKTAKNYKLDYYSKLGEEYHIIDRKRFESDLEYRHMVLLSNELDNKVILDIAKIFLQDFHDLTGVYPKSIYTAGSVARSYIITQKDKINVKNMNFKTMFSKHKLFDNLLNYSMQAYHGGKIESYIIGYVKSAKAIDITSAYPYALSLLPKPTGKIKTFTGSDAIKKLDNYYFALIHCNIKIDDYKFIHPLIVRSPINTANLSPYGYIKDVIITKPEYEYIIKNNVKVDIMDMVVAESDDSEYPYKPLVDLLFNERMRNMDNKSKEALIKRIINSLYGLTFELTDEYTENMDDIVWSGYRAGDFFNPLIACYITGIIRTYLSSVSYNIIQNGGEVYLNMTDSIIYNGNVTLDVFSEQKTLGKFETPDDIADIIILGAGRYEYRNIVTNKYTIKNRGFTVQSRSDGFYKNLQLNEDIKIKNKTFVSMFRATTKKYNYDQLGYLINDDYNIDPFNIGGKRIVDNLNAKLNTEYTTTKPVYLDEYL